MHVHDEQLKAAISQTHKDNYGVYGARKIWLQLNREGAADGRWARSVHLDRVHRAACAPTGSVT